RAHAAPARVRRLVRPDPIGGIERYRRRPGRLAASDGQSGQRRHAGVAVRSWIMNTKKSTPGDWRADMLARIRTLITQADSGMIEERKWRKPSNGMVGVPVWSHDGIVCTGETYKKYVKVTFAKGAFLKDPSGL